MSDKTFIILGPGEGGDDIPTHWNRVTWQWVEGNGTIPETLYSRTEVVSFPSRELPVGGHGIIDVATGNQWFVNNTPTPGEGGEESENKI